MRAARAILLVIAGAVHVALCSLLGLALVLGNAFVGGDLLADIWRYPVASLLFAGGSALVAVVAARAAARGRAGRAFFFGAGGQAVVNFLAFAMYQVSDARAQPAEPGVTVVPALIDPFTLAILGALGLLYAGIVPFALAAALKPSDG